MTKRTRRTHSATFKMKVALATVQGKRTLAELAQQFDVHPKTIEWARGLSRCAAGRQTNQLRSWNTGKWVSIGK